MQIITPIQKQPLMAWINVTRYEGYVLPILAGKDFKEVKKIINNSILWN